MMSDIHTTPPPPSPPPEKITSPLDDPEARAVIRIMLSGLAMAGILARPVVGRGSPEDDGYSLWQIQDIPERAVDMADNLIKRLSER